MEFFSMKNKNNIFIILATLYFSSISAALAECDGFYLAGRAGYAEYELEDDRSGISNSYGNYVVDKKRFMASGAVGYRYKHFRGELEYVWRKNNSGNISDISKVTFKSQSYMFVVYYDFFPYSWFTPFVNAGVGYSRHKLVIKIPSVGASNEMKDTNFTWSLGAGISAKVTNRLNVDVGYRYYDMGDLDKFYGKTSLTDQEVYVGLRYVL